MKKILKRILLVLLVLVLLAVCGFAAFYFSRIRTIQSLEKVTDYEDYNLYRMDVQYSYDLDRLISYGISSNQDMLDAILKESIPLLPIHMTAPNYGCSAFSIADSDQEILMGRNYDFKIDTSALLVHCTPKNRSVHLSGRHERKGRFHCGADAGQRTDRPADRQANHLHDISHPSGAGPCRHHTGSRGPAEQL